MPAERVRIGWYYGWNIVAACLLFQAVSLGLGQFCFTFWVVPWMKEFHAGRGEIMAAMTAAIFMMGILSPVAGWAMDRFSVRGFIIGGGALLALGFALISQASAIGQIVVVYALLIAGGMTLAGPLPCQILAAKWFRARRGLAIGLVSTGTSEGALLFPPLVTAVLASFGWRDAHLLLALLTMLLVFPLAWFVIRNTPHDKGVDPEPEAPRPEEGDIADRPWTTGTILRDRGFQVLVCAVVPPCTAFYGVTHNLGPYAYDLGFTAQAASSFMSMSGGTMLVSKIVFGALADRVDRRYLYWLAIAGLVAAIAIMMTKPSNYWLMFFASALLGYSAGGFLPLMGIIVGSRFGARAFGRGMGLLYPFITLGSIGPLLTGWIHDRTGSYDGAFWLFLLALIPASSIMAMLPGVSKERPECLPTSGKKVA